MASERACTCTHTHRPTRMAGSASRLSTAQTQEVHLYHGDQTGNGSKNSRAQSRTPVHFLTQTSISALSFAHAHAHTHNLAFYTSVPISHLDSERACHLQLMVCRPTRRGTSFINPLNCESPAEGMQHISNMPYG